MRRGDELWIIADDELSLVCHDLRGGPTRALTLFAGELPADPVERKKAKPDLEALVDLGEGLLALASGSKKNRRTRGAWIVGERVVEVELAPLYHSLAPRFGRLNVEGGALLGGELLLLTRRTGSKGMNAMIAIDLAGILAALATDRPTLAAELVRGVVHVELGEEQGAPYGFTDATADGDALLFTAAAEATDDPVEDGACRGCIIGRIDASGCVLARWPITPLCKLEGIALAADGTAFVVADADDPRVRSPLLRAKLPDR